MINSTIQDILKRRSIRRYLDAPIPEELIREMLKAGMSAPSACNQQPWHFIVIESKSILEEISNIHNGYLPLKKAPLAILVCGEPGVAILDYYWEYDCCAAIENMLVAAHSLGLGAVWMGINQRERHDAQIIRGILNIPQNLQPFSFVSAGYPAETIAPAVRFNESRIHYGSFDL